MCQPTNKRWNLEENLEGICVKRQPQIGESKKMRMRCFVLKILSK